MNKTYVQSKDNVNRVGVMPMLAVSQKNTNEIDMAEILKKEGYVVYAPDLYFREVFDDIQKANKSYRKLKYKK